ncbi:antibiotic biosynthesis monooxygenase family protein [Iodobacter fluviatilis]|uniref:Heme-degrading monooxygenase HmoA n=1 Tax=Iodobacter fluviatilis TaxID=537 RepID=A0A377SUK0_9NEIS|nr:antibiotic biosynthesis monooxygenase [Iodobacter fluviatilis]TCU85574.1 heme-degrading monooxygenase HmoA [Iodobacter fluviatilis]STR44978.1 heme-degrading monooxygenase IsdG [Iodobacter fluviatilis]
MFIAVSHFTVANNTHDAVAEAFLQRPHLADDSAGFIRMEVWNPESDPRQFMLVTWWNNAESFHSWHHSHNYRQSHQGIPKNLKLLPNTTRIEYFSFLCD